MKTKNVTSNGTNSSVATLKTNKFKKNGTFEDEHLRFLLTFEIQKQSSGMLCRKTVLKHFAKFTCARVSF